MVADWFDLPGPPILEERAEPWLVHSSQVSNLHKYLVSVGASVVEVRIGNARSVVDVVGALKEVLEFPRWCGSGWDSIDDAFEELRAAWPLPLGIVVRGLPELLAGWPHLALETVLGLSRLSKGFGVEGDQVLVFYVSDRPET
ncbi:hypothetical protein [Demequina sp.]|uniref:barstar family protein n=1 Tax=Demequina sp. TaxID=2050685 RepID=UPI0025B8652B|nr:hypothetical protein [Demequina sp.]